LRSGPAHRMMAVIRTARIVVQDRRTGAPFLNSGVQNAAFHHPILCTIPNSPAAVSNPGNQASSRTPFQNQSVPLHVAPTNGLSCKFVATTVYRPIFAPTSPPPLSPINRSSSSLLHLAPWTINLPLKFLPSTNSSTATQPVCHHALSWATPSLSY
jgi:Flp pilus assembly protein TadG